MKDVVFRWKNVGIRDRYGEPVIMDGEYVRGEWEPIYSLEDREAALAQIDTNYVKPHRRSTKALLSGLLVCGKCGRKLYGRADSSRGHPTYICTDGRKAHLGISAPPLEKYVQEVVFRYIMERTYYGAVEQEQTITAWTGEERLKVIGKKMAELMQAYSDDVLPGSIVFPQIEEFRIEQSNLIAERTQHYARQLPKDRLIKTADEAIRFLRNWHNEPIERRRVALRDELEAIVIAPGEQGKRGFQAMVRRVKFGWKEPHPIFNGRPAEEAYTEPLTSFLVREHANDDGHPLPPRPTSDASDEERAAYEKALEESFNRFEQS